MRDFSHEEDARLNEQWNEGVVEGGLVSNIKMSLAWRCCGKEEENDWEVQKNPCGHWNEWTGYKRDGNRHNRFKVTCKSKTCGEGKPAQKTARYLGVWKLLPHMKIFETKREAKNYCDALNQSAHLKQQLKAKAMKEAGWVGQEE